MTQGDEPRKTKPDIDNSELGRKGERDKEREDGFFFFPLFWVRPKKRKLKDFFEVLSPFLPNKQENPQKSKAKDEDDESILKLEWVSLGVSQEGKTKKKNV